MCQPSASNAIEPNSEPATISPTIMTSVRTTTSQVRRSFSSCLSPRKAWSWVHWSMEWECIDRLRQVRSVGRQYSLAGLWTKSAKRAVDSPRRFRCIKGHGDLSDLPTRRHAQVSRPVNSYEGATCLPTRRYHLTNWHG